MAKEVRIQLTAAQKAKIKAATGKSMDEIRVSSLGKNVAAAPAQRSTRLASEESTRLGEEQSTRLGEEQSTRLGDEQSTRISE
jgi:hypothetical protein